MTYSSEPVGARVQKLYRNRLRECRLRALVGSQVELARRTGIDRTILSALERNRRFLSIEYALLIREVLGCTLDDLYAPLAEGEVDPYSEGR